MLRLLSRFSDAQGKPMSLPWMTAQQRRDLKRQDGQEPPAIDQPGVQALMVTLDQRAHPTLKRFNRARVDPRTAPLDSVAAVSRQLGAVVNALRERPRTMRDLTAFVAQACGFSTVHAQREAYSTVSVLLACDRAARNGTTVELK